MKVRITASLAAPLLHEAERAAKRFGARTRSAAIEHALKLLVTEARTRAIEESLDAYYGRMSSAEQSEERRMVRSFNRSQRRRDPDAE